MRLRPGAAEQQEPSAAEQEKSGVLVDNIFAFILLVVLPAAAGAMRLGLVWFATYAILAAATFSVIAWIRERRSRAVSPETLAAASLTRLVVVLVIGGVFYVVGALLG